MIKFLDLALIKINLHIWSRSEATSIASSCKQAIFNKAERDYEKRYIPYLCYSKTHMFIKLYKQYDIHIMNHFMQYFIT